MGWVIVFALATSVFSQFEFKAGDHVCLTGNALGERLQHQNWFETLLHQNLPDKGWKDIIPASEFQFDPVNLICVCPTDEELTYWGQREAENGKVRVHFEGRLLQCRHCPKKHQCMQNPASANHRNGSGRQVSFTIENKRLPNYTDWMKHRVDSQQGKEIYSHRMSVVEPVFGNIGTNKRLNRFSLRGKKKVQGQWQLYCLVHNIEKLANYGRLAA